MPSPLQLRFEPDTDQTGELFVHAESEGFAGRASAWFGFRQLREFGEQLATRFPLRPDEVLTLQGGYWSSDPAQPILEQTLVGLKVYPVGVTGTIGIAVELMEGVYQGQRAISRAQVRLELLTDYQTLQVFGRGITSLVEGGIRGVDL